MSEVNDRYGIKVSRPGVDVTQADDSDLSYDSTKGSLKVIKVLYFSSSGTQAHGLDYPPAFEYYTEYDTGEWKLNNQGWLEKVASPPPYYQIGFDSKVRVDDTNVYADEKAYVIIYVNALNE